MVPLTIEATFKLPPLTFARVIVTLIEELLLEGAVLLRVSVVTLGVLSFRALFGALSCGVECE